MNRRSYGLSAVVGTLAAVAVLVVVALISQRAFHTWDLTENRRQSLSPESLRALGRLDRDVHLLAFYLEGQPGGRARQQAEDLLRQYGNASRRIRYEMIDPQKQVGRTREYRVTVNETIVVESESRRETVSFADEQKLTNAILKVTREGQRKVYFTTGHGERKVDDPSERGIARLRTALEESGYASAEINLATAARVPEDADALVLGGPQTDLLEAEAERVRTYLERGGHVLLFADLPQERTPRLAALVRPYGVDLREMVLIEPNLTLVLPDPLVTLVEEFGGHPITSGLRDRGFQALLPITRPVIPAEKAPAGVELTALARSSATSWATPVDPARSGRIEARFVPQRDLKGPVTVAVAAVLPEARAAAPAGEPAAKASPSPSPAASPVAAGDKPRRGRLVVIGDVDFATNQLIGHPANRELALGAVAWVASEDAVVAIAERSRSAQPLFLTPGQYLAAFLVALGLPVVATATGIWSWLDRRRRHA